MGGFTPSPGNKKRWDEIQRTRPTTAAQRADAIAKQIDALFDDLYDEVEGTEMETVASESIEMFERFTAVLADVLED